MGADFHRKGLGLRWTGGFALKRGRTMRVVGPFEMVSNPWCPRRRPRLEVVWVGCRAVGSGVGVVVLGC